jgi:hypothetical protein
MREQRRSGDDREEYPRAKMPPVSLSRVLEYVRSVPDIRRDKVTAVRRRMASGSWSPRSTRVAEKILYEHLFDPALS